ncbi:MAG TPA: RNA polymerase sigma factor [Thermoanaerobaculia bacterium]|jgi:RNA polymerase sigma-70 factor (ECF subfamily)
MTAADPTTERLERLLAEHGAAVARVAASYERDRGRQQDLVQEIAVALWRALPGFRGDCSERTFVLRIAHYRGITHSTRRPPAGITLEEVAEPAAPEPGPERGAAARQRVRRLRRALPDLPFGQRQVLVLALEGLSHREIGEVLGLRENAVAVRLNRARQALRARLAAEETRR